MRKRSKHTAPHFQTLLSPELFSADVKFPAKNARVEQFLYKNDHFAKTGSGQTLEKLRKKMALLAPR